MKASKFAEAQKAFILKQGEEGTPVAGICRKAGIGQSTCFAWKKKYGGLLPDEMRRLKQLEDENARLKRIVADLTLDREMLRGALSGESSEAGTDARTGSRDVCRLGSLDRGEDVVQSLERVCRKVGYPKTIRVDNGSEFISRDLDLWAYARAANVAIDAALYRRSDSVRFSCKRQPDQRRKGSRAGFAHHRGAVVLDGALVDP